MINVCDGASERCAALPPAMKHERREGVRVAGRVRLHWDRTRDTAVTSIIARTRDSGTKGGAVSLFVDGKNDGEGGVDMTVPMVFAADETCDVGKETGSPVFARLRSVRQRVQQRGQLGPDRPGEG